MKLITLFMLLVVSSLAHAQSKYPPTKTVDASDTYFGKTYRDPYRWLEDLKDGAVQAWFKVQSKLTDDALAKLPARDALANEWSPGNVTPGRQPTPWRFQLVQFATSREMVAFGQRSRSRPFEVTMHPSLLDQFVTEECTQGVRRLLENAIADMTAPRVAFEFNRFIVTIERDNNAVLIEDVLDVSEGGALRVHLSELTKALMHCLPC